MAVDAKASGDLLPAALCVAEGGRRGNASGNAFGEIAREDLGGFTARARVKDSKARCPIFFHLCSFCHWQEQAGSNDNGVLITVR